MVRESAAQSVSLRLSGSHVHSWPVTAVKHSPEIRQISKIVSKTNLFSLENSFKNFVTVTKTRLIQKPCISIDKDTLFFSLQEQPPENLTQSDLTEHATLLCFIFVPS